MTKDEALDLALEALENSVDLVREDAYNAEKLYGNYPSRQGKVAGLKVLADDHEKAITAIKQARSAPTSAEYAMGYAEGFNDGCKPAPVQPVAWIEHHKGGDNLEWENPGGKCTPLYTTPPAQPAPKQEPFGYFKAEPFGWTDCAETDEGAMALYEYPAAQPAVPDAMTSADIQEHIEYVAGWNDCRQAMLEMMK
jgi:hypothetical protein